MAINIGTLRGYLELDTSKWTSRLQQSAASMDQMADRADRLGKSMSLKLTAPLVGLGTVVTTTFVSFESAMKGVEAALEPTADQLKRLENAAIEWGAKTKFSATESAEALGELGKAGFDAEQSIAALPSVLQLATVAKMGLADAATLTADTLTQFNLAVDQSGRVNDVLAKGAQASTVDVQQLGESLKYAGPVASAFGLSIEDTIGALAEFGNSGIKASMAGTALRSILTDIEVPTKGMSDGLAKLGIETLKSADGTTKLAEVIDTLRARGATAADVMTMFGDRAGPVMVSLVQKGSAGIRDLTKKMYDAQGAAQKVSDTMMSGLGGALEEMAGAVETAGMAVGSVLAPAIKSGAQAIGGMAGFLTTTVVPAFLALPQPIQVTVGVIVALVAATGPLVLVFGQVARAAALLGGSQALGFVMTAATALGNTVPVLTARLWLLDAAAAGSGGVAGLTSKLGSLTSVVSRLLGVIPAGGFAAIFGLSAGGAIAVAAEAIDEYGKAMGRLSNETLILSAANLVLGHDARSFTEAWSVVRASLDDARKSAGGLTEEQIRLKQAVDQTVPFIDAQAQKNAFLAGQAVVANEALKRQTATVEGQRAALEGSVVITNTASDGLSRFANMSAETIKRLAESSKSTQSWNGVLISTNATVPKVAAAVATMADKLADAERQVTALTKSQKAEIDATLKLGGSSEDAASAANKLGGQTRVTSQIVDLYKTRLSESTKATKDLTKATQETESFLKSMADSVRETTQRIREAESKRVEEAIRGGQQLHQAIAGNLTARIQAEENAARIIRELNMGSLEFALDSIVREGEARKKGLDKWVDNYQAAADAIDKETLASLEASIAKTQEFQQAMGVLGASLPGIFGPLGVAFPLHIQNVEKATEKTKTWREGLRDLSAAFANLSESGGGLGGFARIAAEVVGAADVSLQAFDRVTAGLEKLKDKTKGALSEAFADIAVGLTSGVGALMGATDPDKSLTSRILGGAATGAALGAGVAATIAQFATQFSAAGPWAIAAGAVIGIFIAVFRGRGARREMEIIGKEWGQDISKGLFDAINHSNQFGGDRVANSVFRLADFIQEAGGVDPSNFDRLIAKLRDVFVLFEEGKFSAAEAQRVLNENFDAFAQASIATGQLASEQLQEIIQLNTNLGINAVAVIEFVAGQAGRVGQGLAAIAGPMTTEIAAWHAELTKVQEQIATLAADGKQGTQEWIEAQGKLTELTAQQSELIAKNRQDLEDVGTVAVAAFGAAIKAGVGYVQASRQVGPAIDAVIDAQERLGITSDNLALQDLINFRERVRQHETLVTAAEALDDTLLGVSHTVGLNAESLAAMERLGLSTFQRLREAGFSEVEALRIMGDFVENVTQAHIELGIPIDANMGALVDMASQYGVLEEGSKSFEEKFEQGISSLTAAINRLIDAMNDVPSSVDGIGSAIGRLPRRVPIDIEFNVPDLDIPGVNVPQMHEGSHGLRDWGAGTLVELHDREAVVPADEYRDLVRGRMPSGIAAVGGGSSRPTVIVNVDARGALVGDYASQRQLAKLMSDAFMNDTELRTQLGVAGRR